MALQGNLRDFSATEILQLVATQRKTGCLVIEHAGSEVSVFVMDGRIVSTRGEGPLEADGLWRFLQRIRRLSETQLMGIASMHAESKRDFEDLLVEGHYVQAEDLPTLLERLILDDLTRIIEWNEGSYRFDADRRCTRGILVRMSIEASLIEAARRADETKRFTDLFQDGRHIVSVRDLPDPEEEIAEEESELFGIIDGQHTVSDVVAAAPLTDYEANETLHRMIEAGWVEFSGRREPGPGEVEAETTAAPTFRPAIRRRDSLMAWPREIGAIALVALTLGGMWRLARFIPPQPPPGVGATETAFEAARLRDVRHAVELYRRERGHYPERLDELVSERWLSPADLEVSGHTLRYRVESDRAAYSLEVAP